MNKKRHQQDLLKSSGKNELFWSFFFFALHTNWINWFGKIELYNSSDNESNIPMQNIFLWRLSFCCCCICVNNSILKWYNFTAYPLQSVIIDRRKRENCICAYEVHSCSITILYALHVKLDSIFVRSFSVGY